MLVVTDILKCPITDEGLRLVGAEDLELHGEEGCPAVNRWVAGSSPARAVDRRLPAYSHER
jgi:hypothetical protein